MINEFFKYFDKNMIGFNLKVTYTVDEGCWRIVVTHEKTSKIILDITGDDLKYLFAKAYVELKDKLIDMHGEYLY